MQQDHQIIFQMVQNIRQFNVKWSFQEIKKRRGLTIWQNKTIPESLNTCICIHCGLWLYPWSLKYGILAVLQITTTQYSFTRSMKTRALLLQFCYTEKLTVTFSVFFQLYKISCFKAHGSFRQINSITMHICSLLRDE